RPSLRRALQPRSRLRLPAAAAREEAAAAGSVAVAARAFPARTAPGPPRAEHETRPEELQTVPAIRSLSSRLPQPQFVSCSRAQFPESAIGRFSKRSRDCLARMPPLSMLV